MFMPDPSGPCARDVSAKERERIFFLLDQMYRAGQPSEASLRSVAKSFKSENNYHEQLINLF